MYFEVIGQITDVDVIAKGRSVRNRKRLKEKFGGGWRKLKGTALVRLRDGSTSRAELHWFEAHGIGRRHLKIKRFLDQAMKTVIPRYVVCVRNDGADDLEVRKLYRIVDDEAAAKRGYLRVVDESGEDYVYPPEYFAPVDVAEEVARQLAAG